MPPVLPRSRPWKRPRERIGISTFERGACDQRGPGANRSRLIRRSENGRARPGHFRSADHPAALQFRQPSEGRHGMAHHGPVRVLCWLNDTERSGGGQRPNRQTTSGARYARGQPSRMHRSCLASTWVLSWVAGRTDTERAREGGSGDDAGRRAGSDSYHRCRAAGAWGGDRRRGAISKRSYCK